MEIEQELSDIINQTKVTTQTIPMGNITLVNPASDAFDKDCFDINFNVVQYFTALQSLNELFAKYCIEERGAGINSNKNFLKFTYLVQVHLTRLCHYATLNPQNIKYNCFELGIFYVVLLKLANKNHFQGLLKSLLKIQEILFITQKNNKLAMITITMDAFEDHYLDEINLYQQHFGIHLSSTTSGKVTFITKIAEVDKHREARKLLEIYRNTKYDLYQVQLAFKLIEYLYLESIYVEFTTRVMRGKFLTEISQLRSDGEKQQKIELLSEDYQVTLLHALNSRLPSQRLNIVDRLDLSHCDFSELDWCLTSFTKVSFVNGNKHTKFPPHITYCIFRDISFNEEIINNTSFNYCIFIDCDFSNIKLNTKLTNCHFFQCKFTNTTIEKTDLSFSEIQMCNFAATFWYKVLAIGIIIECSNFTDASICFSNLDLATLEVVSLTKCSFVGTHIQLTSVKHCRVPRNILDDALYINSIDEPEILFTDINDEINSRFGNGPRTEHILISTQCIATKISNVTNPANLKSTPCDEIHFKHHIGWITCGLDRLKDYCDHFKQNPDAFALFDKFTNMEILLDVVQRAMKGLNKYLSLYDRCHLTLMTQTLLKNSLFKDFREYQLSINFNPVLYPSMEKNYLRVILFAIHEITQSLKDINKVMPLIAEKKELHTRQLAISSN